LVWLTAITTAIGPVLGWNGCRACFVALGVLLNLPLATAVVVISSLAGAGEPQGFGRRVDGSERGRHFSAWVGWFMDLLNL